MKQLFLFLIASVIAVGCYGQDSENSIYNDFGFTTKKPKANALYVGPSVGVTMTTVSGQPKDYDLFDGAGIGFTGALLAKARFGKGTVNSPAGTGMFGVQLEARYKLNTLKTAAADNLKLGYLEIPVLVQFYPLSGTIGGNGLYIEAGPDIALLMSKSPDVLRLELNQPYPGDQAINYNTGDLKGGDLRAAVGIGYHLPELGLGINARYYLGTSELSKNALPSKLNTMEVSLSWLFKVAMF